MKLFSSTESYKLYHGNMLDMLTVIEPNSIDAIVTDPPYELNFMGKDWDNSGIAFQKETWEKCLKVLKPGGYLLSFGGSRTFHRIACAIEDAGFEIRDTIMYLYGTGFPKSMNIGLAIDKKNGVDSEVVGSGKSGSTAKAYNLSEQQREAGTGILAGEYEIKKAQNEWNGWGTALKPAYEPIIVARKPCEGTCVDNVMKYGVGGINVDECRIGNEERTYKGAGASPQKIDNHEKGDTGIGMLDGSGKGLEFTVNGRFPANVILTYDDTDFDEVCGGMPSGGANGSVSKTYDYKADVYGDYKKKPPFDSYGDSGSAARYFMNCNYNNRDEVNLWEHLFVSNAETNLQILNTQRELFVQQDVGQLLSDIKFHYVKYAENLSVLIETPIVHDIAKILTWDFRIETSQVIQDFIINSKKCTQFQNLVQFVENLDNIDTTPTTQNLLKLFGYVKVVITNYILGNIEFDQKRYIYSPKASKRDRDEGLPEGKHNIHPTVKNTALMQYLIRLVTPKGGTILDPFNGSGSTGKAAMYENKDRNAGYKYIGIELTPEYLPIADVRIRFALGDNTPVEYSEVVSNKTTPKSVNFSGQISLFDDNT